MRNPNGYGSVSKIKGNRRKPWRARVTVGLIKDKKTGTVTQKLKIIGFYETKKDANIALAEYNQAKYNLNTKDITFAEVYDKWSATKFPYVSKSNVIGYRASFKTCEPLHDLKMIDIKQAQLQTVIDTCGKEYPTLRKIKVLFNATFRYAFENDIITKDYSKFVDISKHKKETVEKTPFTTDQINQLWLLSDKNEYVKIIIIMIYTGIRVGEMRELKKECINLNDKYFKITKSKTENGVREVPIADKIIPLIEYWLNKNTSEYLFTNSSGSKLSDRNYRDAYWTPILQDLNIDFTPHSTRHTTISLLAKVGVDERLTRRIVGHAGKSLTENVYTHFDKQQLLIAINKI